MKTQTIEEIKQIKQDVEKMLDRMIEINNEETAVEYDTIQHSLQISAIENTVVRLSLLVQNFAVILHYNKQIHERAGIID